VEARGWVEYLRGPQACELLGLPLKWGSWTTGTTSMPCSCHDQEGRRLAPGLLPNSTVGCCFLAGWVTGSVLHSAVVRSELGPADHAGLVVQRAW
jgi:hypothetical protein